MGLVTEHLEARLAKDLRDHRVIVWYDPRGEWDAWVAGKLGDEAFSGPAQCHAVAIADLRAEMALFTGSYYELIEVCESFLDSGDPHDLLIFVPHELPPEALSPLRELECLGGDRDRYQHELTRLARDAFVRAGLSDSKVDELLSEGGASYTFLDGVKVGEEGGASPLQPLFGTSREEEVLPRFLGDANKRLEAIRAGRLEDVARLLDQTLGVSTPMDCGDVGDEELADAVAVRMARSLLVAEMRGDLVGDEPIEIHQIAGPRTPEQNERARKVCDRFRLFYPDEYERLADVVEQSLGLAEADLDPMQLGRIDTFRFEERALLAACDKLLSQNESGEALNIVQQRSGSFWASVARFPERHAAWEACGALARLGLKIQTVSKEMSSPPKGASASVSRYAADDGWHRMDRLFREARYRLTRLNDQAELQNGADAIFKMYDLVVEPMSEGFVDAFRADGWDIRDVPSQTGIYAGFVERRRGPVAYFHVDAMRYEMGAELAELVGAAGAIDVQLRPAVAVAPTITDLGMVALLPGAEESFSMAAHDKGVAGVIAAKPLIGVAARMDYAKGAIPGLVEMTLDRLLFELDSKGVQKATKDAPVIVIRSQEIDGAGESLPDNLARTVMGSVLENVRQGILRLAEAGVQEFLITADHGHLYGARRGDDMKISPPQGGQQVDLHRRCWVGRGGDTPSSCVRLTASDLGYSDTDLDLVVPRGLGVFKAGGSLSFHHGGLSLQELVIPVLSFHMERAKSGGAGRRGELLSLEKVPSRITNLIFSLNVRRTDLPMEKLNLRLIVEASGSDERRTVGRAIFANDGWDAETQTISLKDTDAVSVGIQIDDENVSEVRVLAVQVETDRTLKDTPPIPVSITK